MKNQTVQALSVKLLQTNPFQPRNKIHKEDLDDLIKSVKIHGVLEPLIIAHTPAGYQIIAGERRWRAARFAGLETVPVIIKKTLPKSMLEMAIVENLQRVNLTAIERAQSFQQLQQEFGYSITEIAERIGKSRPFVSNSLTLLTLPDAIKDGMLGNQITEGHARAIAGIKNKNVMLKVYKQILKENASVRRAEDLARIAKRDTGQSRKHRKKTIVYRNDDKEILEFEHKIKRYLGERAKLKLHRTIKQTRVSFIIPGDVDQTQDSLEKIIKMVDSVLRK